MGRVYIGIGSNIDRERNVRLAIRRLHAHYAPLLLSSVYESDSVGFLGAPFYNLVAGFDTPDSPDVVHRRLRLIEEQGNRTRNEARFGDRTLDLDLLLYDDLIMETPEIHLPREEIRAYAFVLRPLAEIAGERLHPTERRTFVELWAAFDKTRQPIRRIAFDPYLSDA
uniref:2-amino-4-hydroxy-6-hydroxymethyldihydropteridine diphosphokinase n=1 Tax=Candidatus Kentrum sp. DK TaxID=2126562 RepID=A0A450SNY0_9GAMM|nr:MAG: 2-amino-4-hydroxy-6-hydroxymethyldihydropteridinediphosphokinase [Candidatus Kentron sp. DK]VFJ55533.1 MAG: 2-amino-4-hydroxy-6-hydroxymethyldihydropteridinediphosphokinase [Candidatus Kentron sp. DK]